MLVACRSLYRHWTGPLHSTQSLYLGSGTCLIRNAILAVSSERLSSRTTSVSQFGARMYSTCPSCSLSPFAAGREVCPEPCIPQWMTFERQQCIFVAAILIPALPRYECSEKATSLIPDVLWPPVTSQQKREAAASYQIISAPIETSSVH